MKGQIEDLPFDPAHDNTSPPSHAVSKVRAGLRERISDALGHVDDADNRLWELATHLRDPAYVDVATGYDIGRHLEDAARSLRAAQALAQQADR